MGEKGDLLVLPLSTISAIWPKVTYGATVVIIAACPKEKTKHIIGMKKIISYVYQRFRSKLL